MKLRVQRIYTVSLLLLLTIAVAGCATSEVKPDKTANAQETTTTTAAKQAPETQAASFAVFMAQPQADKRLKKLQFGSNTVWYLPRPLLTRQNLASVQPRRTQQGKAFVRVTLKTKAAQRLAAITKRYPGKLLLVTVGNNLVSIVRIQQPITDGKLDIAAPSAEQARGLAQALAGKR